MTQIKPLITANEKGWENGIEHLINYVADVNFKGNYSGTPLTTAANNKGPDCLRFLLEQGADSHFFNGYGRTALSYAIEDGRDFVIDILQDYSATL